jgi:dTDP-4-amino-4,6-dideoxygalactose transaminase
MTPPRPRPFAPWPVFEADEIEAASRVLASGRVNYWTGGECAAFEREFAAACDRDHGISLANGTLALELALMALGIGPGDEVVVPSRTFIATASCVVARGARPVVADVAADSGNLTAETVAAVLTPRTRAVIPVHLAGWPCDMDPILALAAKSRGCVWWRIVRRPTARPTRAGRSAASAIAPRSPSARTRS